MFKYSLQQCVWEITLACCFSCKYCGSKGGKARNNELSTEECLNVAKQLADLGCKRVILIGGEVFLRSDWNIIVKRLSDLGVNPSIISNGFLFTDEIIQKIKESKMEAIGISLDSIEEIHNKYRQEGSFKRAINAIEKLTANNIPVAVVSTLNGESARHIEELYNILRKYNIYAWQIQACSPMGNAKQGVDCQFSHKDIIEFIAKTVSSAPFGIYAADNIGYFMDEEKLIRGDMTGYATFGGCSAGICSIGIDSVGNVRGCESMYDDIFIEGNLRNTTLRKIWESEDSFKYNRKFKKELLTGICSDCRYGDLCSGGCRSYNYFTHGKLYEAKFCAKKHCMKL